MLLLVLVCASSLLLWSARWWSDQPQGVLCGAKGSVTYLQDSLDLQVARGLQAVVYDVAEHCWWIGGGSLRALLGLLVMMPWGGSGSALAKYCPWTVCWLRVWGNNVCCQPELCKEQHRQLQMKPQPATYQQIMWAFRRSNDCCFRCHYMYAAGEAGRNCLHSCVLPKVIGHLKD